MNKLVFVMKVSSVLQELNWKYCRVLGFRDSN
jgi:hypothetical protein